jgi:IS30 family transposase
MRERSINAKKRLKQEFFCIPNRTDISERPKIVEEKVRVGDWEGDTIISHGSHSALLTLVDRHSKYTIIRKVWRKTSENLSTAIINSLKKEGLPVRTITFDNGSEFAGHQRIAKKFDFKNVTDYDIKIIQNFLNSRPRNVLNYLAPVNVIFDLKSTTAVAFHS